MLLGHFCEEDGWRSPWEDRLANKLVDKMVSHAGRYCEGLRQWRQARSLERGTRWGGLGAFQSGLGDRGEELLDQNWSHSWQRWDHHSFTAQAPWLPEEGGPGIGLGAGLEAETLVTALQGPCAS